MSLASILPEWSREAICAQVGSDFWYPESGSSGKTAREICATCPVRRQCLDWALENGEKWGIWGGLSERERRKLGPKRRCLGCDQPFLPESYADRICSEECRRESRRVKQDASDRRYNCIQCGAPSAAVRCRDCQHRYHVSRVMTREQTKAAA